MNIWNQNFHICVPSVLSVCILYVCVGKLFQRIMFKGNTFEVIHSPSFPYDLTQSFYQMYIRVFVSVFEGICRCMGLFTRMTGFGWLPIDGSKGTHMNVLFRCYIVSYFGTHIICTSKASMRSTGKKKCLQSPSYGSALLWCYVYNANTGTVEFYWTTSIYRFVIWYLHIIQTRAYIYESLINSYKIQFIRYTLY